MEAHLELLDGVHTGKWVTSNIKGAKGTQIPQPFQQEYIIFTQI